jgi:hypothetical protein
MLAAVELIPVIGERRDRLAGLNDGRGSRRQLRELVLKRRCHPSIGCLTGLTQTIRPLFRVDRNMPGFCRSE